MIYRMKQNAAGLASICILSTGVLLLLSMTVSLYFGMGDIMVNRYPFDTDARISGISQEQSEQIQKVFLHRQSKMIRCRQKKQWTKLISRSAAGRKKTVL